MTRDEPVSLLARLGRGLLVLAGASGMTFSFFVVLPLIQAISEGPDADLVLATVDTASLPPPPPPPQEEPEQEPEPEEEPPQLDEPAAPLDLSQLELALDPGFGDGWAGGDFSIRLDTVAPGGDEVDALFSSAELDQKPRVVYQPGPVIDAKMRKKAPGTVYVLFVVDQQGRVQNPIVQNATDPIFERPALSAVKQWKFEPGKRNGRSVRFRMRVPVTFPRE